MPITAVLHHLAANPPPVPQKPLWPIIGGMTLLLMLGLPFMLRTLWPAMKAKTAWLIALAAGFVFAFVLSPVAVGISNILRSGRSM